MTFSTYSLQVKARTWNRDSYGLYDYGTFNYEGQAISIASKGIIARDNDEIRFINSSNPQDGSQRQDQDEEHVEESMISINETPFGVRISSQDPDPEGPNQFWMVLEQEQSYYGQQLQVGDVVRFGRVILRVKQIKLTDKSDENKKSIFETLRGQMKELKAPYILSSFFSNKSSTSHGQSEKLCKICLAGKTDEENDPMISPCKCTGSVKYVHLKCLQSWVMSKLSMQHNKNVMSIFWKKMDCELCKEALPITFVKNGKEFSLVSFDSKMTGSYIMFESFCKDRNLTGIHFIDLSSNNEIKIGRGRKCEFKILDVSISREHASIKLKKGKVYLKDTESKFGTLKLLKEPILLDSATTKSPWIQWGRSMMRFSLSRKWFTYFSCVTHAIQCNQVARESSQIELKKEDKINESLSLKLYSD